MWLWAWLEELKVCPLSPRGPVVPVMVGGTPYPVCKSSWGYLLQEKQLPGGKFWKSFQEGPPRYCFFSPSNNCVNPTMIYVTCIEHWTLLRQLQNWQSSMRPWWRFGEPCDVWSRSPRLPLPILCQQLLGNQWLTPQWSSGDYPRAQRECQVSFPYTPPLPTGDLQPMTASCKTNSAV